MRNDKRPIWSQNDPHVTLAWPLGCKRGMPPFDHLVGSNLQIHPDRQAERFDCPKMSTVCGRVGSHEAFALSAPLGHNFALRWGRERAEERRANSSLHLPIACAGDRA
jgi:hypothetical protein